MTIQIYNTLTRQKEAFQPLQPRKVTIYNCGPTVYDHFHIGNARNFVVMDVVRRYFEYRGFQVRFVQNLTDIDDKIIQKAQNEGVAAREVTDRFIPCYFEDAAKLRIRPADAHPRATEHVAQIVALIRRLIEKGLAYEAHGSVYYAVRQFADYGKLSGRNVDDLREGARVEVSDEKRDPLDFALWKAAKPGEPTWESPWGAGRPGWHIECSAMAMALLGETIDIHAGGTDLTFPHHENEIAQSEGATGRPFARYWMHNGFLNIDSQKMSKSLGNFLKIDQVLERCPAAAVRHFLLSAHYRSPLDLTEEALERSRSAVERIQDAIQTAEGVLRLAGIAPQAPVEPTEAVERLRGRFEESMDDDFNTPKALAVLFDAVTLLHEARQAAPADARLAALTAFARDIQAFFGLEAAPAEAAAGNGLTEPLMALLIDTRKMARAAKAFAIADTIRDRLGELGIVLEDHPQGTLWKRKEGA
jgi:cysteinyl-tRNA synthetase